VDGEKRVGGVNVPLNPPRQGEGDRAKRGGGAYRPLQRQEVYTARKLRREMSLPEVLLWEQIRGQKLGIKFRRQHPIGLYTADFYCAALRMVLEIDGKNHDFGDRPGRDEARDQHMRDAGFQVLRVEASQVLKNMDGVLALIRETATTPLHRPFDGPPPRAGEDL
jgi:very-short-patch-repair endonuclease